MGRKVTLAASTLLVLSMLVLAFRTPTPGQSQPQNPVVEAILSNTGNNGQSITVTGVSNSKTIVQQGYPIQTSVTITNNEAAAETFNLTLYLNTTLVGNQQDVNLTSGDTTAIIFKGWDGLNLPYGNYTLKACVWPANAPNTNYTSSPIIMTVPGDTDGDFSVKLQDLVNVAVAYGSKPGDPNWNTNADIDGNNVVALHDLVIVAQNYGESVAPFQNVVNGTTPHHVGGFAQVIDLAVNSAPYRKYSDQMSFSITVLTISQQPLAARGWPNATLLVDAYDALGQPIGITTVPIANIHATLNNVNSPGGATVGMYSYNVTMSIPNWAVVGPATVTAYVLTDLPNNGGVPLGPQLPAVTFLIKGSQ